MLPANGRRAVAEGEELAALLVGGDEQRGAGAAPGVGRARVLERVGQLAHLPRRPDVVVPEDVIPAAGASASRAATHVRQRLALEREHHPAEDRRGRPGSPLDRARQAAHEVALDQR